jgi:hypothetical protein
MRRKIIFLLVLILAAGVVAGCQSRTPAYLRSPDGGSYLDSSNQTDTQIRADITAIRSALLAYAQVKNTFPPALTDLVPNFLDEVPRHPVTNEPYEYRGDLLGGDYEIKYRLSDGKEYTATKNTTDLQMKQELEL